MTILIFLSCQLYHVQIQTRRYDCVAEYTQKEYQADVLFFSNEIPVF